MWALQLRRLYRAYARKAWDVKCRASCLPCPAGTWSQPCEMGLHRCRTALLLSSLDLQCAEMYWVYLCPVCFWMVTLSSCNWYDNMARCVTLCIILCWCLPSDCCWNIMKMTKTPQHYLKISQAQFGGIMSQRATERTRTHMHAEIDILKKRLQGVACPMSFQGPSLPKYKKESKDSTGMSRHKYGSPPPQGLPRKGGMYHYQVWGWIH